MHNAIPQFQEVQAREKKIEKGVKGVTFNRQGPTVLRTKVAQDTLLTWSQFYGLDKQHRARVAYSHLGRASGTTTFVWRGFALVSDVTVPKIHAGKGQKGY